MLKIPYLILLLPWLTWAMECRDVFSIQSLGEGLSGNELHVVMVNERVQYVQKRYVEETVLANDVEAIRLLEKVIAKSKDHLRDLEIVEVLEVKDKNTLHISYAKGSVVENLFERQRLNSMPDAAREKYHYLRDLTDQPNLRKPPTDLEQAMLENPSLIGSLRQKYVDVLKRLDEALKQYVLAEGLEVTKYDVKLGGAFPYIIAIVKKPTSHQSIQIYIKPDNLVLTTDSKFIIFDPY